jgi:hypothetical protein
MRLSECAANRHPFRTLLLCESQRPLRLGVVVFFCVSEFALYSRNRRMRRSTFAYIAGVSSPVCVFCWLG